MTSAVIRFYLVAALIVAFTVTAWPQAPFTLEQVMGSPFPSELVSAKQGSRVAWVFEDDGQPIASLRLTPDGTSVVYALGTRN